MKEAFIEVGTQVVLDLLLLVISVAFAYLTKMTSKTRKLEHLSTAMDELNETVINIVGDLQQTVVDGLKEKSADGKLSKSDIEWIGQQLVEKAKLQISLPAAKTILEAGVDLEGMIHSIAEAEIARIKRMP